MTKQKQAAESGIEKVRTGIEGFDEISGGGIPRGRTTLVVGGSGCGKTVFALQTLVQAARELDEPGIFVSFEENSRQLVANAASFGWDIDALGPEKLFFLDARLAPTVQFTGEFDLSGLLASVSAKAREMGARRIVFDSIDVMLALLDDVQAERREIYRLHDWLLQSGLTGVVTGRVEGADPGRPNRYSFMQFMADCVVGLQMRLQDRVLLRELRIMKYRGSGFAENEFPMVIGPSGIEVANLPEIDDDAAASIERVSTGVERLDAMLRGGYFRGSGILITGMPGTAKSTLAGAFAEAACLRGEPTLFLSFDEIAPEIIRNLSSVGIRLGPHVESGLLHIHSAFTAMRSAEEHFVMLRSLMRDQRPRAIVVDPISSLLRAGGPISAFSAAERLIQFAKGTGATLLCTALTDRGVDPDEVSKLPVSTLADTWIHLSYVVQGGERNRALTIVKSRGTKHSNQVRELILDDGGVTLKDVYAVGGEVLMGTARWERESAEEHEQEMLRADLERKRRELQRREGNRTTRLRLRDSDMTRAAEPPPERARKTQKEDA